LNKLKNSVWAKYMGGPHGQKSVWATAHTVPAPMPATSRNQPWHSNNTLLLCDCMSFYPSVCLTVKCVLCEKTKGTCANNLTSHERSFILVFWQEEWLVGAIPSTWNFGPNWPLWSKNADFQSVFARITTAVTPSKKS